MSYEFTKNGLDYEFELYQAASNDWCVSVWENLTDTTKDYNLGATKESALEFILSYAE